VIKWLKNYIYRQQMEPGLIGLLVNPFYFARRSLYEEMRYMAPNVGGRILDVGCGSKPYRSLFVSAKEYIGLEIDTPHNREAKRADFFYDGEIFPFESVAFDGVICNQVLEHVFNPDVFLQEIHRVLKPGGNLLLTVPFVWDEHEQPWDYARYSSFGLRSLVERNGFFVIEQRKTNADARVLFQLINAYIFKILQTKSAKLNLLACLVFMAPVNLIGVLLGKLLPPNPDLYLDQVILTKKGE
jgi:SAM-dependent methyltransferase